MKRICWLLLVFVICMILGSVCGFRMEGLQAEENVVFHPLEVSANAKFWEILGNNLAYCGLLVLGCGFVTVPLMALQGVVLGIPLGIWLLNGKPLAQYLLLLLPHAVLEIPGLLLAACGGFQLLAMLRLRMGGGEPAQLRLERKAFFRQMSLVVLLILAAAAIESFLTLKIYERFWMS